MTRPTIIIDSREQLPWRFTLPTTTATLDAGDYGVVGLEALIVVERKSLCDLVACCGGERERFVRELQRLAAYPFRAVVVEATLADLEAGEWRGRVLPSHVLGSVASWAARYCPFVYAGDAGAAGRWAERYLIQAARCVAERYAAAAGFLETVGATPASVGATPAFSETAATWYERAAKERMVAGGGDQKSGVAKCPHPIPDPGKSRDAAGVAVGVSGQSVDRARKVRLKGVR